MAVLLFKVFATPGSQTPWAWSLHQPHRLLEEGWDQKLVDEVLSLRVKARDTGTLFCHSIEEAGPCPKPGKLSHLH